MNMLKKIQTVGFGGAIAGLGLLEAGMHVDEDSQFYEFMLNYHTAVSVGAIACMGVGCAAAMFDPDNFLDRFLDRFKSHDE